MRKWKISWQKPGIIFGIVFGFSKYKIKDCGYVGVSVGHGLYDFLNTLVRMFIV